MAVPEHGIHSTRMHTFADRFIGAARLSPAIYEEVEADKTATGQAMLVVALASVAAGIGSTGEGTGRYCQVEADSRFWCQVWRVHDGLERSILGVDRLALRQLDSTQAAAAPAGRLRYVAPRPTPSPRATHHRVRARRMPMRGPRSNGWQHNGSRFRAV